MANINEVRAERADIFDAAQALVQKAKTNKRDLQGADLAAYNGLVAQLSVLDAQIAALAQYGSEAHGGAQHRVPVGLPSAVAYDDAGGSRLFARGESIAEHVKQQQPDHSGVTLGEMARAMVTGNARAEVRAALNEGTSSAGGVTVPTVLSGMLIDQLRARSTVFASGARTLMLDTATTNIAAIASDATATWRAENAAVSVSDMSFTPITLTPKCLAVIVQCSRELVEDSLLLDQAIVLSLTKAFASELDRVALIGTGTSNQPLGVANVTGIGSVSQGTNGAALTAYDPFVTALGTLQTANAADPTAVIMHPRSSQELNLLKDTQNRPLARPACLENLPFLSTSKLPINMTQGSANTASLAIMGNFADVIVGMRHNIMLEVLREKYADNFQLGFLATLRADVAVCHAASFAKVIGIL